MRPESPCATVIHQMLHDSKAYHHSHLIVMSYYLLKCFPREIRRNKVSGLANTFRFPKCFWANRLWNPSKQSYFFTESVYLFMSQIISLTHYIFPKVIFKLIQKTIFKTYLTYHLIREGKKKQEETFLPSCAFGIMVAMIVLLVQTKIRGKVRGSVYWGFFPSFIANAQVIHQTPLFKTMGEMPFGPLILLCVNPKNLVSKHKKMV